MIVRVRRRLNGDFLHRLVNFYCVYFNGILDDFVRVEVVGRIGRLFVLGEERKKKMEESRKLSSLRFNKHAIRMNR